VRPDSLLDARGALLVLGVVGVLLDWPARNPNPVRHDRQVVVGRRDVDLPMPKSFAIGWVVGRQLAVANPFL
jgi:hypothetical protein